MKNREGQPICGHTCDGPIVGRGRKRPMYRWACRRVVKVEGDRCWQHRDLAEPVLAPYDVKFVPR